MNPTELTIAEAGARLRAGTLTAAALTEAHLDLIARRDPAIGAFVTVTPDSARAAATRADADFARGVDRGPLQGIPLAFKDLIDVAGTASTCGSRSRPARTAPRDSEVARRLCAAGAVPLGKLATYEFGLVGPSFDGPNHPPVNPWNPDHVTGGSSSGPAAAIAAGLLRVAIGSDTGGSIRSPAAYCGVVGLKPTYGRIPLRGVFPVSPGLDHLGPLAATVSDAALTLDAMTGAGPNAAASLDQPIVGLSIGYAREWFARDPALMPEVLVAIDGAVSRLARLGARVEEIRMPEYGLMESVGAVILHAEAWRLHRSALRTRGADYGKQARASLASGMCLGPGDLAAARVAARILRATIDAGVFARHGALVTANTLATAPPFAAFADETPVWTPMRTMPFNVTGHPALAIPVGFAGGLPIGMQIVGKALDEAGICRIGAAYERDAGPPRLCREAARSG